MFEGSETVGQWSGEITEAKTLTPTVAQMTYTITSDTITVNNHTGAEKTATEIMAVHGSNNDLQASHVKAHEIAAGINSPITWTHNLDSTPANIKVFVLEKDSYQPFLVKAAA